MTRIATTVFFLLSFFCSPILEAQESQTTNSEGTRDSLSAHNITGLNLIPYFHDFTSTGNKSRITHVCYKSPSDKGILGVISSPIGMNVLNLKATLDQQHLDLNPLEFDFRCRKTYPAEIHQSYLDAWLHIWMGIKQLEDSSPSTIYEVSNRLRGLKERKTRLQDAKAKHGIPDIEHLMMLFADGIQPPRISRELNYDSYGEFSSQTWIWPVAKEVADEVRSAFSNDPSILNALKNGGPVQYKLTIPRSFAGNRDTNQPLSLMYFSWKDTKRMVLELSSLPNLTDRERHDLQVALLTAMAKILHPEITYSDRKERRKHGVMYLVFEETPRKMKLSERGKMDDDNNQNNNFQESDSLEETADATSRK